MSETKPSNNGKQYSVKLIIVGVPKAVMNVIYVLDALGFAKASGWFKVKQTKAPDELTMVITLEFIML